MPITSEQRQREIADLIDRIESLRQRGGITSRTDWANELEAFADDLALRGYDQEASAVRGLRSRVEADVAGDGPERSSEPR